MSRSGKRVSRQAKVWWSIIGTVASVLALTWLALWLGERRETDLVDGTASVTAGFKDEDASAAPPIRFRNVASEVGIDMRHAPGKRGRILPEDTGSGIAWGDVDGDGDWDLFVVNYPGGDGQDGSNHLYRNDGGRFVDITAKAGVADPDGFGMGATFVDYDQDGDTDLYVTNMGPNRLFRNHGDGTFDDVAAAAGVADELWSAGAAWGDIDRDGDLDLYVCNYVLFDDTGISKELKTAMPGGAVSVPFTLNPNSFDPQPNHLYRNDGNGQFEEVAAAMGVENPDGRSLTAVLCDLDGDGWLDIYVNNDVSTNRLYLNMMSELGSQEQFLDLSSVTGSADPRGSMGLSIAELGEMAGMQDDLPDLFITHWIAQENALYLSVKSPSGFEYRDKTRRFQLGEMSIDTVGWGSALVDLDLDGRLDLAVANGSTLEQTDDSNQLLAEPMFLMWNEGTRFGQIADTAGPAASARHSARGLAAADFDSDGDVDLAISINRGQPLLLANETSTTNKSLNLRLDGAPAVCIGARVVVEVGGRRQMRWWGADVTFLGCHAQELVFGLGEQAQADRVHVRWLDGSESTLTDVPAGRVVVAVGQD